MHFLLSSPGEGLSGLIPAMVALGQGAGEIYCVNVTSASNITDMTTTLDTLSLTSHLEPRYHPPRFTVRTYFFILSLLLVLSGVAFILLNKWKYCRSEFVSADGLMFEAGNSGEKNVGYLSSEEEVSSETTENAPTEGNASQQEEERDGTSASRSAGQEMSSTESEMSNVSLNSHTNVTVDLLSDMSDVIPELSACKFWTYQLTLVLINMTFTTFLSTIQVSAGLTLRKIAI